MSLDNGETESPMFDTTALLPLLKDVLIAGGGSAHAVLPPKFIPSDILPAKPSPDRFHLAATVGFNLLREPDRNFSFADILREEIEALAMSSLEPIAVDADSGDNGDNGDDGDIETRVGLLLLKGLVRGETAEPDPSTTAATLFTLPVIPTPATAPPPLLLPLLLLPIFVRIDGGGGALRVTPSISTPSDIMLIRFRTAAARLAAETAVEDVAAVAPTVILSLFSLKPAASDWWT